MGVPQYTTPLMNFIRTTKESKSYGPTIVHCRYHGVGNTWALSLFLTWLNKKKLRKLLSEFQDFIHGTVNIQEHNSLSSILIVFFVPETSMTMICNTIQYVAYSSPFIEKSSIYTHILPLLVIKSYNLDNYQNYVYKEIFLSDE